MPKLTKRIVDQTEPAERDVWVWDEQLPGFGLRVKPSGVKSFLVQYRDERNRTRRVTLGRYGVLNQTMARDQARQLLANVARGENPAVERRRQKAEAELEQLPTRARALGALHGRAREGAQGCEEHQGRPAEAR